MGWQEWAGGRDQEEMYSEETVNVELGASPDPAAQEVGRG